jgi:hypothetical protein
MPMSTWHFLGMPTIDATWKQILIFVLRYFEHFLWKLVLINAKSFLGCSILMLHEKMREKKTTTTMVQWFFYVINFHQNVKNISEKNIMSQFSLKHSPPKKKFNYLQKSSDFYHNCLQYDKVLKIFLLSYFEYCQIWLNILLVECHLSNITKLKIIN